MTHATMISQYIHHDTDPVFGPVVNRYGCRVFVLLAIPQFVVGHCLLDAQIIDIIDRCRQLPNVIVNDKLRCGTEEHQLINMAFRMLGSTRNGRQVGWDPAHILTKTWQYMVPQWDGRTEDGHYTLMDRGQREIYDPHDPIQAGYAMKKSKIVRRLLYATWETG